MSTFLSKQFGNSTQLIFRVHKTCVLEMLTSGGQSGARTDATRFIQDDYGQLHSGPG